MDDARKGVFENAAGDAGVLAELYALILARNKGPVEDSYTCYLFEQGLDKILKKCCEECGETVIAAKNFEAALSSGKTDDGTGSSCPSPDASGGARTSFENEVCDLVYHLLVLLARLDVPLEDISAILWERSAKIGNLKKPSVSCRDS
jgi:phosphoribosyl-ATP pyrophosphohydrolase